MALIFGLTPRAGAGERTPLEQKLFETYNGKTLKIRGAYCGPSLQFDANGRLSGTNLPGDWTICRDMVIEDVRLEKGNLRVSGRRIFWYFDKQKFRDITELTDKKGKSLEDLLAARGVTLEVALSPQAGQDEIESLFNKVFLPGPDAPGLIASPDWSDFLVSRGGADLLSRVEAPKVARVPDTPRIDPRPPAGSPAAAPPPAPPVNHEIVGMVEGATPMRLPFIPKPTERGIPGGIGRGIGRGIGVGTGSLLNLRGAGIERVGGKVTAPRALHTPAPSYSDEARKWQIKGTTTLIIVVDPGGNVPRVQIARPIGMGLDARAAAMVRTWKFEPAMKDGIPVAVMMMVEVNFDLF